MKTAGTPACSTVPGAYGLGRAITLSVVSSIFNKRDAVSASGTGISMPSKRQSKQMIGKIPRTGKGQISSGDTKPENPFPKKKKKHSKQQAMVNPNTLVQKTGKIVFRNRPQRVSVGYARYATGSVTRRHTSAESVTQFRLRHGTLSWIVSTISISSSAGSPANTARTGGVWTVWNGSMMTIALMVALLVSN